MASIIFYYFALISRVDWVSTLRVVRFIHNMCLSIETKWTHISNEVKMAIFTPYSTKVKTFVL